MSEPFAVWHVLSIDVNAALAQMHSKAPADAHRRK